MKKNNSRLSICMMLIAICVFTGNIKAQSLAKRVVPENTEEKKADWKALKLNEGGTNVKNGVEVYIQKAECTKTISTPAETSFSDPHSHKVTPDRYINEKVALLKLVNTNTYAVKVSFQESDFGTAVNILIPPSGTIEGTCTTTDSNLAKLVIHFGKTDEEKQKQKSSISSSLSVTNIQ